MGNKDVNVRNKRRAHQLCMVRTRWESALDKKRNSIVSFVWYGRLFEPHSTSRKDFFVPNNRSKTQPVFASSYREPNLRSNSKTSTVGREL